MTEREMPVRSQWELAGPFMVLVDTLLLLAAFRYGMAPPLMRDAIVAGIALSVLALVLSALYGRWWVRIVAAGWALLCLWVWLFILAAAGVSQ